MARATSDKPKPVDEAAEKQVNGPSTVTSPDVVDDSAVVVKADGSIDGGLFGDAEAQPAFVVAQKDIIEEFYFPNTKRPAYRVLYTKGQRVPQAEVERLQARAEAVKAAKEEAENPTTAGFVDSTTLASGTGAGAEHVAGLARS